MITATQQATKIKIVGLEKVLQQAQKRYLGFNSLYKICYELSKSQGFYSRLFRNLQELDNEQKQELDNTIKQQKFTNEIDLILSLEN